MDNIIERELSYLTKRISKLEEDVDTLQCRTIVLWGTCIVLTSVLTATFMYVFIL